MSMVVSVIIPAHDEARYIGRCLAALLDSDPASGCGMEVIVVANGCRDDTAAVARRYDAATRERGWRLKVLEIADASKIMALNAGDLAAIGHFRVYLDADVHVSQKLIAQLVRALGTDAPRYATGTPRVARPESRLTRAYARFWQRVPFNQTNAPGFGIYAVNAQGRARWAEFPQVVADDTFVRLHFTPAERMQADATYTWPMVEGLGPLVRVRRRQDAGTAQIAARYPHLIAHDDKVRPDILALAKADPTGFAAYALVSVMVRLGRPFAGSGWSRGR